MWPKPILWAAVLLLAAAFACVDRPSQDGYAVLFEGAVEVYEDGIYDGGIVVGKIQSKSISPNYATRMMITLLPEFADQAGNHIVFYVRVGRLEVDRLKNFGDPLTKGAILCGFESKGSLNWFKTKSLLNDRIAMATQRSMVLQERFNQQK